MKNLSTSPNYLQYFLLSLIIIIGFFLRLYKLDFQSLWLDELHTAATCGPGVPFERFLFIYTHDNHPPLYYFIEWIWLNLVGTGDNKVRFPSVVFGTLGIYAIYFIGTKIKNTTVGLIAAAVLCINVFHIEYSQEARQYALFFLLVTFSFAFLYDILINKKQSKANAILYTVFTTCFLYTHYFGVYLLMTQAMMVGVFYLYEKKSLLEIMKPNEYRLIFISAFVSVILFSPMIPVLIRLTGFQDGREAPSQFVYIEYLFDFFGKNPFVLLVFFFSLATLLLKKKFIKENKLAILFILLWIGISLFIPYAKSLLSAPTMHIRYVTGSYPILVLIVALGIYSISNVLIRNIVLASFLSMAILNLFREKRLYSTPTKCDWRSMGKFMAENNANNYPLRDISPDINPIEMDYRGVYSFYPNFYGNKTTFIKDQAFLQTNINGIWIFESWWMPGHEDFVKQLESKNYTLTKDARYFGSRAMLYETKK